MRIEYEDDEILVVYKEAGIPVQAGRVGARDLVSILKNYLAGAIEIPGGTAAAATASQVTDAGLKNGEAVASAQKEIMPAAAVNNVAVAKTAVVPAWRAAGNRRVGGGEPYLGIVHRLDQPVEGLLVFAKTPKAAAALSRQAAGKDMRKVYQAGVDLLDSKAVETARLAQKKVVLLTDYLARDYKTNSALVVPEGTPDSKLAELTYRTLELTLNSLRGAAAAQPQAGDGSVGLVEKSDDFGSTVENNSAATASAGDVAARRPLGHAVLEVHLQTGRHHQIRVQLAHAGLPLSGDRKYNPSCAPHLNAGAVEADFDVVGPLQLCAVQLQFLHPTTRRKMKFQVTPSWR